ncbi:MAG: hypothetical protein ABI892_10320, partial [Flavobacterium sp.]
MYNKKLLLFIFLFSAPFLLHSQVSNDSLRVLKEVILKGKPYQEVIPVQSLSGKLLENLASHNVADA